MTGSEKQPQRQFTLKSNKQQLKLHKKKKKKLSHTIYFQKAKLAA